jgi:demethylmenaquinone methyltransferase/2-methoxy-6-polyprenyl-1,4-benzoquinol methylase
MFGSIARRYDLANHALSCGFDFYWRKRAADIVQKWQPREVLDLATGTGDLALVLQRRLSNARVVGADFSEEMLAVAESKGLREVAVADARQLSFADESFDVVTIAFGLRNLPDWGAGLREIHRVLRPAGHVLILEFSLPRGALLRSLYRLYLHRWVPFLGHALTKQKGAYDYLGESIEKFPSGQSMIRLIEASGFVRATARSLTGGVVTIYTAERG